MFTQGCSDSELPSGPRGIGFKFANSLEHQRVLSLMRESKIPYVETERGMVNYLLKNHAEVSGIQRRALYGNSLDYTIWEAASIVDSASKKLFDEKFQENKIPYTIVDENGELQITWSQIYGPQVDIIQQEVMEERMLQLLE